MPTTRLAVCLAVPAGALLIVTTTIVSTSSLDRTVFTPGLSPDAPIAWQRTEKDCGLAAVATLARLLGVHLPEYDILLLRYPPHAYGHRLDELARIAADLGIRLDAVRVTTAGLESIPLPAIAHLRSDHFVVLVDRSPSGWQIADPGKGILRRPPEVVGFLASGTVLVRSKAPGLRVQ